MDFKPQDTFNKFNEYLGGLVVFVAFYLEEFGLYVARSMKNNLGTLCFKLLQRILPSEYKRLHVTLTITIWILMWGSSYSLGNLSFESTWCQYIHGHVVWILRTAFSWSSNVLRFLSRWEYSFNNYCLVRHKRLVSPVIQKIVPCT